MPCFFSNLSKFFRSHVPELDGKFELKVLSGRGIGLVAREEVQRGDLVVRVPQKLMLSMSNVAATPSTTAAKAKSKSKNKVKADDTVTATVPVASAGASAPPEIPKALYDLLLRFGDNPTFQLAALLLCFRAQGSRGFHYAYIAALPGYTEENSTAATAAAAAAGGLCTPLYWNQECLSFVKEAFPSEYIWRVMCTCVGYWYFLPVLSFMLCLSHSVRPVRPVRRICLSQIT